ncbi:MAG TPA: phosphoadenosine phosphosulfate reductase family protein [Pyrinomonadaceae bacterium]
MKKLEKLGFLVHAKSKAFEKQLISARACVRRGLDLCKNPYVSFSAGKDSACVLWLVLEQMPDIPVRLLSRNETRLLHPDLDDCVTAWLNRFPGLNYAEINADRLGEYGTNAGNMRRVLRADGDFDGGFIGLRREESGNRAFSLLWHRIEKDFAIHRYAENDTHGRGGSLRICPIENWKLNDVGALIASHSIPILALYDEKGLSARTSPALNRTARAVGETAEFRKRNPAKWNEFLQNKPDLSRES